MTPPPPLPYTFSASQDIRLYHPDKLKLNVVYTKIMV